MIIEGEAAAYKQINQESVQVFSYKKGDYFGERALLMNEARAASIIVSVSNFTFNLYSLKS
jgi:CRP-like cAMP-binding protein